MVENALFRDWCTSQFIGFSSVRTCGQDDYTTVKGYGSSICVLYVNRSNVRKGHEALLSPQIKK